MAFKITPQALAVVGKPLTAADSAIQAATYQNLNPTLPTKAQAAQPVPLPGGGTAPPKPYVRPTYSAAVRPARPLEYSPGPTVTGGIDINDSLNLPLPGGTPMASFSPGNYGLPTPGGGIYGTSDLSLGGVIGSVSKGVCQLLPAGPARDACLGLGSYLGGSGQGNNSSPAEASNLSPSSTCPAGYVFRNGRCEQVGVGGAVARTLPGGNTGVMDSGAAVKTVLGVGLYPTVVGSIMRQDGTTGPILRCPAGMVLGKDDICYVRQAIPNNLRRWPRGPRPLLSAQDGKVLRRAHSLEKKLNRVAGKYLAPAKPTRKKKGRGRAKK